MNLGPYGHLAWLHCGCPELGQERSISLHSSHKWPKTAADEKRRRGANGTHDIVIGNGESPDYFFVVAGEMTAHFSVSSESHLYVHYSNA